MPRKRDKQTKGKSTIRQQNINNRINGYAKLIEKLGYSGAISDHKLLPKRYRGFNKPGSGKRT